MIRDEVLHVVLGRGVVTRRKLKRELQELNRDTFGIHSSIGIEKPQMFHVFSLNFYILNHKLFICSIWKLCCDSIAINGLFILSMG
jgi:hypothetical protein